MKRIYLILLTLFCVVGCCNAQLIHSKGQMGLGVRGGGAYHGWNIGLMYNYQFSNDIALLVELDREKAKFEFSNFTNTVLLGVGANFRVWKPTIWLNMHLSATGNVGYDIWDCTVVDWKHENTVFGGCVGLDFEFTPWSHVSLVTKGRQWMLFGSGDSYAKPDYSLGVKVNW